MRWDSAIPNVEIQYMYSKALTTKILLLGNLVSNVVRTSHHWKMERRLGEPAAVCLTTMIPEDENQNISVALLGDQQSDILKVRRVVAWVAAVAPYTNTHGRVARLVRRRPLMHLSHET